MRIVLGNVALFTTGYHKAEAALITK